MFGPRSVLLFSRQHQVSPAEGENGRPGAGHLVGPDGLVGCAMCDGGLSREDVQDLTKSARSYAEKPVVCNTHRIELRL